MAVYTLLKDIEKAKNKWNERSSFKLKGVGNLSQADLESLILYADAYIRGTMHTDLMPPVGEVREVLEKYGIV